MTKNYTAEEAAGIFRVTVWTIREWIKDGKLTAVKVGRKYLIPEDAIKSLLEDKHG